MLKYIIFAICLLFTIYVSSKMLLLFSFYFFLVLSKTTFSYSLFR